MARSSSLTPCQHHLMPARWSRSHHGDGAQGGDGVSQAGGGLSKGREFASAKGLRWVRGQTAGKAGSDLRGEGRDARKRSLIGSRRSCPWSRSKTQTRHAHVHFVCKTSWHGVRDFFNDCLWHLVWIFDASVRDAKVLLAPPSSCLLCLLHASIADSSTFENQPHAVPSGLITNSFVIFRFTSEFSGRIRLCRVEFACSCTSVPGAFQLRQCHRHSKEPA